MQPDPGPRDKPLANLSTATGVKNGEGCHTHTSTERGELNGEAGRLRVEDDATLNQYVAINQ